MNWSPIILSLKLASLTTMILLVSGIPLAYFMTYSKWRAKIILDTALSLPIVLPPSVLGFYLLIVLGPHGVIGKAFHNWFNIDLAFTFQGILIASIIYSLPFMFQSLKSGFESLSPNLKDAASTLGHGRLKTVFYILLPNMAGSIMAGIVMTFAHTLGEFGVILMIGGSVPHETRVASIAIYDEVEALNFSAAHEYSVSLLIMAILSLLFIKAITQTYKRNSI